MMQYTRIIIAAALIAACAADVFSADKLFLRYSFDALPPTDEGASKRGSPTTAGAPAAATGQVNGAASFNPTVSETAPLDLYFVPDLILSAPLTFTAWFSIDGDVLNSDLNMKILSQKTAYDDAQGIEVQYNAGKKEWTIILPGTQLLVFAIANQYTAGSLHHVAVTVSLTVANLYLDGVYAGALTLTTPLTGNTGKLLTIGGSAAGNVPNRGGAWHGVIDELRIYNFALTGEEVTTVFSNSDLLASTTSSDELSTTSSSTDPASTTEPSTTDPASTTEPSTTEPSTTNPTETVTPSTTQNSASSAVPTLVLLVVAVMAMVL